MNKERMLALANYMEALPPKRFNMMIIVNGRAGADFDANAARVVERLTALGKGECGSAGCIAGHAAVLFKLYDKLDGGYLFSTWTVAAEHLGLNNAEASWLFDSVAWWAGSKDEAKDPRVAANAIRCLATMGLRNCFKGDKVMALY